jgi:hypothetical protein
MTKRGYVKMTYALTIDGEAKQFENKFNFDLEIGKYDHFGYKILSLNETNCTMEYDSIDLLDEDSTYLTFNISKNKYELNTNNTHLGNFDLNKNVGHTEFEGYEEYTSFTAWKEAVIDQLDMWSIDTNEIKWELVK